MADDGNPWEDDNSDPWASVQEPPKPAAGRGGPSGAARGRGSATGQPRAAPAPAADKKKSLADEKDEKDPLFQSTDKQISSALIDEDVRSAEIKEYCDDLFDLNVVGQTRAKRLVQMIVSQIETHRVRRKTDAKSLKKMGTEDYHHMIIQGPNDTGKHLMGTMMAKIYRKMGIAKERKCIRIRNTTFKKFAELVEEKGQGDGGIVICEEAHHLLQGAMDKAAIQMMETILASRRTIVIFTGPTDAMEAFVQTFPSIAELVPHRLTLNSYSEDELVEIFSFMCGADGQSLEEGGLKPVLSMVKQIPKEKRNHLNAAVCSQLLDKAKFERDARLSMLTAAEKPDLLKHILVMDIKRAMYLLGFKFELDDERTADEMLDEELKKVVGLEKIKDQLRKYVSSAKLDKLREEKGVIRNQKQKYHMIFSGPPGTGKTMIAQLVAKILLKLELVPSNTTKIVNKGADMAQPSNTVDATVASANGGVLFVDEAYTMLGSKAGTEAVESLMKHLDPPSCVIIIAGYKVPMDDFLRANEGLERRIPYRFEFLPYTKEQLLEILELYAVAKKQVLAGGEISDSKDTKSADVKSDADSKEKPAWKGPITVLLGRISKKKIEKRNAGLVTEWVDAAINERDARISQDYEAVSKNNDLLFQLQPRDFEKAAFSLGLLYDSKVDGMEIEEFMEKEFSKLIGCDKIKIQLRKFMKQQALTRLLEEETGESQGADEDQSNNMVFTGSPGTGKTHIAKLVAKLLLRLGVTKSDRVVEIKNGLELVGEHMNETPGKVDRRVAEAQGGVMVIDEAYSLSTHLGPLAGSNAGAFAKEAIDTIMKHMDPPACVFIFCGYDKEMDDFLSTNPGLNRRVKWRFRFDDYTVDQLLEIWAVTIKHAGYTMADGVDQEFKLMLNQVSPEQIKKRNAGLISTLLQLAQGEVKGSLDIEEFKRDRGVAKRFKAEHIRRGLINMELLFDLAAQDNKTVEEYMEGKFAKIVGHESVKDLLRKFCKSIKIDKIKEQKSGKSLKDHAKPYHFAFTGPPGVGKTMWARVLGQILLRMGIVQSDKVVEVGNPNDLMGAFQGQSAPKVEEKVKEARGGILFIDEAYSLLNISTHGVETSMYAKQVIDTIMKHLEPPSCVFIFAGYAEPMKDFLRANEGLDRRIPFKFDFPAYGIDELVKIFDVMVKSKGERLEHPEEDLKTVRQLLLQIGEDKLQKSHNAGLLARWIGQATIERAGMLELEEIEKNPDSTVILTVPHLKKALVTLNHRMASVDAQVDDIDEWMEREFKKVVGCQDIKDQLIAFRRKVALDRIRQETKGDRPAPLRYHMIFSGPPGTGKTMIAKLVGKMMLRMGLIQNDRLLMIANPNELVGQYVGHSAPTTERRLEEGRGGVIFIDEAYSITEGGSNSGFSQQVIDTIMKHLDPPSAVFIFAGYEKPMDRWLKMNPGLERRIPYRYRFTPYSLDDLMQIFEIMCKVDNQIFDPAGLPAIKDLIDSIPQATRDIHNADLCKRWVDYAKVERDNDVDIKEAKANPKVLYTLTAAHFEKAFPLLTNTGVKKEFKSQNAVRRGPDAKKPAPAEKKKEWDPEVMKSFAATIKDAFKHFDADKDGFITPDEMMRVYGKMKLDGGADLSGVAYQNTIAELTRMDTDRDFRVSFNEYMAFWMRTPIAESMAEWKAMEGGFRRSLGLEEREAPVAFALAGGDRGPTGGGMVDGDGGGHLNPIGSK